MRVFRIRLRQPGDLAPVLNIKRTEVAGDMNRSATGDAVGLLPTGQAATRHRTIVAGQQPAVAGVLIGLVEKCLPYLPTGSQRVRFLK